MSSSLRENLDLLNHKDPEQTAGLIDMYVYEGSEKVWVGKTHAVCLPAFEALSGEDNSFFESANEREVVFSRRLQSFEERSAALKAAVVSIDSDPEIMGSEPTQYSLNDIRPIPRVKDPLLGIPRPYCRKGFSVPTDFANMIIQREDGKVLFTVRAENIGHSDDVTGADNYAGKFDLVGGAHTHDAEDVDLGVLDIHFRSLIKAAEKKVGITADDIEEMRYLGTTAFKHTRGDFVFHDERHQIFLAQVAQDWSPRQDANSDVQTTFWATPKEALHILQSRPVKGYSEVQFNGNSAASTTLAFLNEDLGIITPESVGQDEYEALADYYNDPSHRVTHDPILHAIRRDNPDSDLTFKTDDPSGPD